MFDLTKSMEAAATRLGNGGRRTRSDKGRTRLEPLALAALDDCLAFHRTWQNKLEPRLRRLDLL